VPNILKPTVTKTFQIETVDVGPTQLFIMDTPGINSNTDVAGFTEIARGIDHIRSNAQIVGVLYVFRIFDRNEATDDMLRTFLSKFCGPNFIPHVTFVMTHWTAQADKQKTEFNRNLTELKRRNQNDFVSKGANFYEHGREFLTGDGSPEFLHWRNEQNKIADHAKLMISTWYGRNHGAELHFV
jgi:hypothetical protein